MLRRRESLSSLCRDKVECDRSVDFDETIIIIYYYNLELKSLFSYILYIYIYMCVYRLEKKRMYYYSTLPLSY